MVIDPVASIWGQTAVDDSQHMSTIRVLDFEVGKGSPFANDQMGRQQVIINWTARYIDGVEGPCFLAINGSYGTGKSAILSMWAKYLRDNKGLYHIAEINLWKTSYLDSPLLALLLELDRQQIIKLEGDWWRKLLGLANRGVNAIANRVVPELSILPSIVGSGSSNTNEMLADLKRFTSYQTILQEFDSRIANKLGDKRLVIFVDELDRCDASYAVRCLEVIKLLVTAPQIVFVAGVNLAQLDLAVHQRYGWDAQAYRRRFIDLVLDVPPPVSNNLQSYFDNILATLNLPNNILSAKRIIRDTLLGKPDESGNETDKSVMGTTASLRELRQFLNRWGIVCRQLLADSGFPESHKTLAVDAATVMLIAKHLAPKLYGDMLEGSLSDADVFEAVDQALGSRAAIYTSQTIALLKAVLSLCVIVAAIDPAGHNIRTILERGELKDMRPSELLMNTIEETGLPNVNAPLYRQLPDSQFKQFMNHIAKLTCQQLDRIASAVEGYQSGALGQ